MTRRFHQYWGLFAFVALSTAAAPFNLYAQPRIASVKRAYAPLDDFRRIELLVPKDFNANCRQSGLAIRCTLNTLPDTFTQLLVGLRGGNIVTVELENGRRSTRVLQFRLQRKGLAFREAVLEMPRRWVVEVGLPEVLMGDVQPLIPFRPYPVSASNVTVDEPPARISPPDASNIENQGIKLCYDFWEKNNSKQTLETCGEVLKLEPDSENARLAKRIIAEVWIGLLEPDNNEQLPQVIGALKAAEAACKREEQGARYALLAAKVYEALDYINRAEMHLANRIDRYKDPSALSYLLAARARLLIQLNESSSARKVLDALRRLKSDAPTVGSALGALAELAYHEKKYVVAMGLYDMVNERWPQLLRRNSTAMFELGELYMLYGRIPEAKQAYEQFLKLDRKSVPDWMAHIRLLEIMSFDDPTEAAKGFKRLIQKLRKTEGQDLAFLRLARLTEKPRDRRRIIRNLGAAQTTRYVFAELTVQSIQQALDDGNLFDAYRYAVSFWRRYPDDRILVEASRVFDRVLTLNAQQKINDGAFFDLIGSYYADRSRYEKHELRGAIHLKVAEVFRDLAMAEEAILAIQAGVGGRTPEREPNTAAELYRLMAAILWSIGDRYRLGEIMDYLDKRYAGRFDDYDYWMARGHRLLWDAEAGAGRLDEAKARYTRLLAAAEAEGRKLDTIKRERKRDLKRIEADADRQFSTARKIFLYALNGPIPDAQKLNVMDVLAHLYTQQKKLNKAAAVYEAYIKLFDKTNPNRQSRSRRDRRWRLVELHFEAQAWGPTIAALSTFLSEYPDDPARLEARYLMGTSLLRMGDEDGAKRQFDLVSKEDSKGFYGRLARLELKFLQWRKSDLQSTLRATNL